MGSTTFCDDSGDMGKNEKTPDAVKKYFEMPPEVRAYFVETGRIGGKVGNREAKGKGGATTAAKMTPEQRIARAKKAAEASVEARRKKRDGRT